MLGPRIRAKIGPQNKNGHPPVGAYPEFACGMRIDFLGNNQFTYEIFTPGTPSGFWRRRIFWPNIGLALAITPQVRAYINWFRKSSVTHLDPKAPSHLAPDARKSIQTTVAIKPRRSDRHGRELAEGAVIFVSSITMFGHRPPMNGRTSRPCAELYFP